MDFKKIGLLTGFSCGSRLEISRKIVLIMTSTVLFSPGI